MANHKYAVLIGRFEPFHNGHLNLVYFALQEVDELIIILGSCNVACSIKNPWTAQERREMILSCIHQDDTDRITFIEASDYLYNDNRWITTIQQRVDEVTDGSEDVVLFGEHKDRSSFYLEMFPQWKHIDAGDYFLKGTDATKIRVAYFEDDWTTIARGLPMCVEKILRDNYNTQKYKDLRAEYEFVKKYKAEWSKAPYPPTFVTVDTVVICSGHVLLVRRKGYPGKGLMALPGGFLNQHERIQDAAIRELREETRIALTKDELHAAIVDQRVFDHPDRSTRGRTITHAFCLNLGTGKPPKVKGDDDAEHAFWLSFTDVAVKQSEFYEDHFSLIQTFLARW